MGLLLTSPTTHTNPIVTEVFLNLIYLNFKVQIVDKTFLPFLCLDHTLFLMCKNTLW